MEWQDDNHDMLATTTIIISCYNNYDGRLPEKASMPINADRL